MNTVALLAECSAEMNKCLDDLKACELLRKLRAEYDEQAANIAEHLDWLAEEAHNAVIASILKDAAGDIRDFLPTIEEDRVNEEECYQERIRRSKT